MRTRRHIAIAELAAQLPAIIPNLWSVGLSGLPAMIEDKAEQSYFFRAAFKGNPELRICR